MQQAPVESRGVEDPSDSEGSRQPGLWCPVESSHNSKCQLELGITGGGTADIEARSAHHVRRTSREEEGGRFLVSKSSMHELSAGAGARGMLLLRRCAGPTKANRNLSSPHCCWAECNYSVVRRGRETSCRWSGTPRAHLDGVVRLSGPA